MSSLDPFSIISVNIQAFIYICIYTAIKINKYYIISYYI